MLRLLASPLLGLLKWLGNAFSWLQWGKERERRRQATDALEGAERGREGAQDAQDQLDQGKTPEEIVRDNDGKW